MNLSEMIQNVRAGKLAKITGTRDELKQARKALSNKLRISVTSGAGCLYVYKSSAVVFLPRISRQ